MRRVLRRVGCCAIVYMASAMGTAGCSPSVAGPPAAHPAPVHAKPPVLTEPEFGPVVRSLLAEGDATSGRTAKIASAVHYLLGRARGYFDREMPREALQTVTGALFLARSGELHPKSLTGFSLVLADAADEASRRGDEGRARALYEMARAANNGETGPAVDRANGHLRAIETWESATQSDGTMQAIASRRLAAVKRALVRRDGNVVDEAERQIGDWVERAVEINRTDAPIESMFDQDERIAARMAFLTGAQTMIALHLRDGNAARALGALDSDVMAAITEPRWVTLLLSASEGNADSWSQWFRLYQSALEQPEFFDSDLARAAQWGVAVELARAESKTVTAALPLLSMLNEFGMPDVAPVVLASRLEATSDTPSPDEARARQAAMGLVLQSLVTLARQSDLALARSVFTNVEPLLQTWSGSIGQAGSNRSFAAVDFYETMGALEVRHGHLERALALLNTANEKQPTPDTLRLLATIERQRGEPENALTYGKQLQELAVTQQLPIAESQARLLVYDTLLDSGRAQEAAPVLAGALEQLLTWRQKPATPRFAAEVERCLAQVLERYGELDGARRANERARAASVSDEMQLSDVLLDESRRSLTFGELSHGRLALRHALEANIESATLVYAALWQRLLELRVGAASDGTVEEAFGRVLGADGWPGSLAQWGTGRLADEQLLSHARTTGERVEARFYVAMKQFARNASPSNKAELQTIASSPAIELIEVRIARDLTSKGAATGERPPLPKGVTLP